MAIKTTRKAAERSAEYDMVDGYSGELFSHREEILSLMDEAKTMWKVGSYNENIVNLQGVTAQLEEETITQVRKHFSP